MDPSSYMSEQVEVPEETTDYNVLDEKLKALEASHKASQATKKNSKSKKRKSLGDDEKTFKPGKEDDEDEESLEGGKPKKKRKPPAKKEPVGKKEVTGKKTTSKAKAGLAITHSKPLPPAPVAKLTEGANEDTSGARTSIDSVLRPIDEEETAGGASTANVSDAQISETAAIRSRPSANFSRMGARSRSPNPRNVLSQTIAVEQTIVSRTQSNGSPPVESDSSKAYAVANDSVTDTPGTGVASTTTNPTAQTGIEQAQSGKEHWEWPEDVF